MRILQLIDSLNPGGAEKMAVSFANEWVNHSEKSFLIATNTGGKLKNQINNKVHYKIYNRSLLNILFIILQILWFVKKNKITHVQAHTSSYKWAKFIKIIFPNIQFYWHDHNGNRINWAVHKNKEIINYSKYFDGVFACNEELKHWAIKYLKTKNCHYIPNFATLNNLEATTKLKGEPGKRMVCIANLRDPKNHLFLIKAFHNSGIATNGWTLHLVGKAYNDIYENELIDFLEGNNTKGVHIYGVCTDTSNILSQSNVGILVSTYEGFPVTVLEYGLAGLCPIVSSVGHLPYLVQNNISGYIINPQQLSELELVFKRIECSDNWKNLAINYQKEIIQNYSAYSIINKLKIIFNDN